MLLIAQNCQSAPLLFYGWRLRLSLVSIHFVKPNIYNMTGNATLTALLFVFLIQSVFTFPAYGQGAEIKESGLELYISSNSVSTSFYVFECGYGISDWRDVMEEDICAPLVWIGNVDSSGCIDNGIPLAGKIAVIWEGGCSVATKAAFAQQTGALAVLIAGKSDPQYPPISRYPMGLENELPAVQIPVFYLTPSVFQHVNMAFQSGSEVMACLKRPAGYLTSLSYPSSDIQQFCFAQLTPFQFKAGVSNLSGMDIQNVTISGALERENGEHILGSVLHIPEIQASVTDSTYILPDVFNNLIVPPGIHQVTYTIQGTVNGVPYVDIRRIPFDANSYELAKELKGSQTAYRPDSIPTEGWAVANLYYLSGHSLDLYTVDGIQISVFPGQEMDTLGSIHIEVFLFGLNEDILPDLSNFDTSEFYSSSLSPIGVGNINIDLSENQPFLWTEILDLNTAAPAPYLEPNKYYLLAATFSGESQYLYQGFDETYDAGKVSTLVYTDKWHLGGFYGSPNAALRMDLSIGHLQCPTINTREPYRINFKISPNPVQDYLTLQMAFEESTDAFITFFDINGRVITADNRKGLIDDQLTYPASKFTNGANIVRVTTQKGSETKMFVVQNE